MTFKEDWGHSWWLAMTVQTQRSEQSETVDSEAVQQCPNASTRRWPVTLESLGLPQLPVQKENTKTPFQDGHYPSHLSWLLRDSGGGREPETPGCPEGGGRGGRAKAPPRSSFRGDAAAASPSA